MLYEIFQSADDVSDPRELSSETKNLIVFDICYLKNKTPVNRIMSEEDTATTIVFFSSTLFQVPTPNNQRQREFHLSVSPRPQEP